MTSLPARRRSWTAPLAAVAGIAAAVAIALGAWAATRPGENAFAHVLSQPGARVVSMGGRGALAVAPDGQAAIALTVPPAPRGKTYEAWVIRNGTARRGGLFGGRDGTSVLKIERAAPSGSVVAVTLERAGGVDRPTQKPLAATEAIS